MLVCALGEEGVEAEAQVTGTRAHLPAERPPRLSGRRREPAAPPAYINPQLLLSRLAVSGCRPPRELPGLSHPGPQAGEDRWLRCSGLAAWALSSQVAALLRQP